MYEISASEVFILKDLMSFYFKAENGWEYHIGEILKKMGALLSQ